MRNRRIKILIMTNIDCVAICNVLSHAGYAVSPCHDIRKLKTQATRFQPDIILIQDDLKYKSIIQQFNDFYIVVINDQHNLKKYSKLKKAVKFDDDFVLSIEEILQMINRIKKQEYLMRGQTSKVLIAKKLLMKKYQVTEPAAYGYLRKESMNKCIAIEVVSEQIIKRLSG